MPQSPQSDGNRIAAEKPGVPGRPRHAEVRFVIDSLLEGDGFEPSVPRKETTLVGRPRSIPRNSPSAKETGSFAPGTDGSNPPPSSGESANHRSLDDGLGRSTIYADRCSMRCTWRQRLVEFQLDFLLQVAGRRYAPTGWLRGSSRDRPNSFSRKVPGR
jgi:hypothetical protein